MFRCVVQRVCVLMRPSQTTRQVVHVRTHVHCLSRLTTCVCCIQVTYPPAINLRCADRDCAFVGHTRVCSPRLLCERACFGTALMVSLHKGAVMIFSLASV